jgi:hypothetical protein
VSLGVVFVIFVVVNEFIDGLIVYPGICALCQRPPRLLSELQRRPKLKPRRRPRKPT